jgi:type IV pilus assembly protein PilW
MELLVAAAVGGVVITGTLALYVSVLESATYQNAAANVQESGRFAIDQIARTLRMAGYDDLDTDGLIVPVALEVKSGNDLSNTFSAVYKGKDSFDPKPDTDSLTVQFEGASSGFGQAVDCAGKAVGPDELVKNIFAVSSDNELLCFADNDKDSEDQKALYVVAEGVEDLWVAYGIDDSDPPDGVAERYVPQTSVAAADLPDVVSIKVAVLVNSGEATDHLFVGSRTMHSCPSCDVFSAPSDGLYRAEFHATVRIRTD